eukprot:912008-Pyramimonas_sp.AAC.1
MDKTTEILASRDEFSTFLSADLAKMRTELVKGKKDEQLEKLDRYLAEFSDKMDPVIGDLERETRILMSQQRAREIAENGDDTVSTAPSRGSRRSRA